MSRLQAVIAEDEEPQRRKLVDLLGELWPELEIVAQCEDGLAALESITSLQPAVAFLDIRMPGLTGLEIARAAHPNTHVVFTTAYNEYAVSAFDEGAVDYLLKPIKRERLEQTVARLKDRAGSVPAGAPSLSAILDALQGRMPSRTSLGSIRWITGSVGNVTKMFGVDEVVFFQAQDKYVRVATLEDEVQIRTPLRELLSALDPEAFWRIHRSVIVRAAAIHRIESDTDGKLQLRVKGRSDVLPVSSAFQYRFKPM
ncbi:MAG TPA: LytTR family DNA-binding domain-containing protein [Steroidobacteraceae bacterium]|jgi:DNA-binding LytR/AlgR family response regulator